MQTTFTYLAVLAAALPAVAATDFRGDAVERLAVLEQRYLDLAKAIPAEKYTWRPGDGVRSTGEVILHVALVNFAASRAFGIPAPETIRIPDEKSPVDRTQALRMLADSFAYLRKAFAHPSCLEENKPIKMFGEDTTVRRALLMNLEHLSEHLGQSIAYARANGIVPPWSRETTGAGSR